VTQWFAPTRFSITFEKEGLGRFTEQEIEQVVVRNADGKVVSLNLPTKSILLANHQTYADWWYAWCLTYFMRTHKDVFIVLKKSLKWIPIVGWAMQFFKFIFLARSWASDRVQLATDLSALGHQAEQEDNPMTLILYPEGTLVSRDTRPISKKFADKMGIPDMANLLLPRSTGLHYSLRSLGTRIPSLHLIDLTIVYPGIPAFKYGQSYYSLRSIFFDRVPPPVIHVHLRVFNIQDVPIGDISASNRTVIPNGTSNGQVEVDIPEKEKEKFDLWLRELWRDKDQLITRFLATGHFTEKPDAMAKPVDIPLELRHKREIPNAFCFFLPALVGCLWAKLRRGTP